MTDVILDQLEVIAKSSLAIGHSPARTFDLVGRLFNLTAPLPARDPTPPPLSSLAATAQSAASIQPASTPLEILPPTPEAPRPSTSELLGWLAFEPRHTTTTESAMSGLKP